MRRAIPLVLLALAACKNETSINEVPKVIEIVPDLSDPGDVPVGVVLPLTVQIAHLSGGDVTVSLIDVLVAETVIAEPVVSIAKAFMDMHALP